METQPRLISNAAARLQLACKVQRVHRPTSNFYRAMLRRARHWYGKLSVRLHIRLSVRP